MLPVISLSRTCTRAGFTPDESDRDDEIEALREENSARRVALEEASRRQERQDEVLMSKDQFIIRMIGQLQEAGVPMPGGLA